VLLWGCFAYREMQGGQGSTGIRSDRGQRTAAQRHRGTEATRQGSRQRTEGGWRGGGQGRGVGGRLAAYGAACAASKGIFLSYRLAQR
jgi:hypothetical protein